MDHATHNKIVSFIWFIADGCLCDVFVREKVIAPAIVELKRPGAKWLLKRLRTN